LVTEDPTLLNEACYALAIALRQRADLRRISRVIGPAMGAIAIAHSVAASINILSDRAGGKKCLSGYTEKIVVNDVEQQAFKRTTLENNEIVLTVEDVITTGGSVEKTDAAVFISGGELFPFILTLVNRSGLAEVSGREIVALINQPMPMWQPDDCPLCKRGSIAIRPKGAANWTALNAAY
jgi:orotate phosphoribosyltransferase